MPRQRFDNAGKECDFEILARGSQMTFADNQRHSSWHLLLRKLTTCSQAVWTAYSVCSTPLDRRTVFDEIVISSFDVSDYPMITHAYLDAKQCLSPWPTSLVVQACRSRYSCCSSTQYIQNSMTPLRLLPVNPRLNSTMTSLQEPVRIVIVSTFWNRK